MPTYHRQLYAHGRFIGMNGIKRLITGNLRSNMGIVARCYDAGFSLSATALLMALATSVAVANASPAVSALTTPRVPVVNVDLFTLNAIPSAFVFGGRTCAVNKFQRGIVFVQCFDIFIIDLHINSCNALSAFSRILWFCLTNPNCR